MGVNRTGHPGSVADDAAERSPQRIDVVVILYHPHMPTLAALFHALIDVARPTCDLSLHLWRNDGLSEQDAGLAALVHDARAQGLPISIGGLGGANLGFGRGINALLPNCTAPWVLVLNQDAVPEPGAIESVAQAATHDAPDVAAWECRQIPYEHPKDYDPVTLDTIWCSGAAVLLRTQALRQVQGFEPRFFMYCEDVDLAWRLQCEGWRTRYLPRAAVVHRTYSQAGEIKPLAVTQGCYANLCIRTRYAGRNEVQQGVRQLLQELRGPQAFEGRRAGLLKALAKFIWNYRYFRRTRRASPSFTPCIAGWDYEMRRTGVFHPFRSASEWGSRRPVVAVIVDPAADALPLAERLSNLQNQTHRPMTVVVLGHAAPPGEPGSGHDVHDLAIETAADLPQAMEQLSARGVAWLLRAPTDAQHWYADHVEVLLQSALDQGKRGASAEVWQVDCPPDQARDAHRRHATRQVLAPTHPAALQSALVDIRLVHAVTGPVSWEGLTAVEDLAAVARVTQVRYQPFA